jgi:hypothetical protein
LAFVRDGSVTDRWTNRTSSFTERVSDSGTMNGIARAETRVHLALTKRIPLTERLDLEVFGGPSLVSVSGQLIAEWGSYIWYGSDDAPEVAGPHWLGEMSHRTMFGLNVGAGVSLDVHGPLAAVARLRYTLSPGAQMDGLNGAAFAHLANDFLWYPEVPSPAPATSRAPSGGLTFTLGLRYTFK